MAMLSLLVLHIIGIVTALPANPYSGASTLYRNPPWVDAVRAPGSSIATHPSLASLATSIASFPTVTWLTSQSNASSMTIILDDALHLPSPVTVTFVAYFIPNRDCNRHHAGGATSLSTYETFITTIVTAARAHPSIRVSIILEPGAVSSYSTSSCTEAAGYPAALQMALTTLAAASNIAVYLDIGNSGGSSIYLVPGTAEFAAALIIAKSIIITIAEHIAEFRTTAYAADTAASINTILTGTTSITALRGFSTNVANYYTLRDENAFIEAMGKALLQYGYGNMRFLLDTSRNGVSSSRIAGEWCNILGASLGMPPKPSPAGYPLIDAFLWVAGPGRSDGSSPSTWPIPVNRTCMGRNSAPNAPATGVWFESSFAMLLQNAIANSAGPMTGEVPPTALSSMNPYQESVMYRSTAWEESIATATRSSTVIANTPAMLTLAQKISLYGDTTWITSQSTIATMDRVLQAASSFPSSSPANDTTVTFVVSNIPRLGCNADAGSVSLSAYQNFCNNIVNEALAYPIVRIVIILEPDVITAVATGACNDNNALYMTALQMAVKSLSSAPNIAMYIDIGSTSSVPTLAILNVASLISSIVGTRQSVRGLATNVGGYTQLDREYAFIESVSSALSTFGSLARLRFITDTSRNGLDTYAVNGEWCNINGAALSREPTASPQEYPLLDALLYVKSPGESDGFSPASVSRHIAGTCSGPNSVINAPFQGMWFSKYFEMLLANKISGVGAQAPTASPATSTPVSTPPSSEPAKRSNSAPQLASTIPLPMMILLVGMSVVFAVFLIVIIDRCRRHPSMSRPMVKSMINPKILRNISRMNRKKARGTGINVITGNPYTTTTTTTSSRQYGQSSGATLQVSGTPQFGHLSSSASDYGSAASSNRVSGVARCSQLSSSPSDYGSGISTAPALHVSGAPPFSQLSSNPSHYGSKLSIVPTVPISGAPQLSQLSSSPSDYCSELSTVPTIHVSGATAEPRSFGGQCEPCAPKLYLQSLPLTGDVTVEHVARPVQYEAASPDARYEALTGEAADIDIRHDESTADCQDQAVPPDTRAHSAIPTREDDAAAPEVQVEAVMSDGHDDDAAPEVHNEAVMSDDRDGDAAPEVHVEAVMSDCRDEDAGPEVHNEAVMSDGRDDDAAPEVQVETVMSDGHERARL